MNRNSTPSDSLLLGYNDAARLLQLSRPTLERMVRANTIPFIRLGKSVRFRRAALEQWLIGLEQKEKSPASENQTHQQETPA